MSKELKYEAAFAELQSIVTKMENDELDIDQLSEQLKRAQELIKLCKDKLTKTDEEIKKILAGTWFFTYNYHVIGHELLI